MIGITKNQINMHKRNICGNEIEAVDNINLKGFVGLEMQTNHNYYIQSNLFL